MRADLQRGPWRPLLEGERAERAWESILRIRTELAARAATADARSWPLSLSGWSGVALFFAYLDVARPETGAWDQAVESIDRATGELGQATASPGLAGGFTGFGWVVEHLFGGPLEPGEDDLGGELAATLCEHLGQTPWLRPFDLVGGLAGYAIYGCERLPRSAGREILARVATRLSELAEAALPGATWHSSLDLLPEHEWARYPAGNYNLGLAHGVPGVIAALSNLYAAGVEPRKVEPLAEQAVAWLLAQKLPPQSGSVFPYNVARGIAPQRTGTAWCYGDLGIAVGLLGAARRMRKPLWEREAIELGEDVAARPLPPLGGRADTCLCHGAAGNGHLLNRLFQATGEPRFARAADAWFGRALDLVRPDAGIGGFQFWDVDDRGELTLVDAPGFLEGSAGIGLALLAAVTPIEPLWDRLLAAAVPGTC